MGSLSRRRRASPSLLDGRRRSAEVAARLGRGLVDARDGQRLTQAQVATLVGLSQPEISRLERGSGATASIETWACVGSVLGLRLAAFFEQAPGASRPRDYEHLKRQELIVRTALAGGWRAMPEMAIDPRAVRSRSIDVVLRRNDEIAVVEVWDLLDDVGAALRGLNDKVAAVARAHPNAAVRGILVLRRTARNRRLVGEFRAVFAAKLPGDAGACLAALSNRRRLLPPFDCLLWTDVAGERLIARLG